LPLKLRMFFLGIRLLPPRAGIIAIFFIRVCSTSDLTMRITFYSRVAIPSNYNHVSYLSRPRYQFWVHCFCVGNKQIYLKVVLKLRFRRTANASSRIMRRELKAHQDSV
jgi:hypothetical protein